MGKAEGSGRWAGRLGWALLLTPSLLIVLGILGLWAGPWRIGRLGDSTTLLVCRGEPAALIDQVVADQLNVALQDAGAASEGLQPWTFIEAADVRRLVEASMAEPGRLGQHWLEQDAPWARQTLGPLLGWLNSDSAARVRAQTAELAAGTWKRTIVNACEEAWP
ncbi:MAG: hypothetical protein ERJ67_06580 [Aphanocapsa feldmannii 277cV]|uniref:Uncharacterized protein n=2 Tax=Aphanocapsa feldmannii TaxID=192050 RepID=A0A524RMY1_9CHRO|nr:MAG: hypothetical protein ERJ67_06580 [Aphanocapsa feldmannii 277cV]TGH21439.1 MAG: hypothetical protein ERJ68_05540 [Aphanocapsa feldmannii 277cI]